MVTVTQAAHTYKYTYTHTINSDVMRVLIADCKNCAVASDSGWDPLIEDTKNEETVAVFCNTLHGKSVLTAVSFLITFYPVQPLFAKGD